MLRTSRPVPAVLGLAALLSVTVTGAGRADTLAITGATVHTMGPAGTLEGATLIVQDGRIQAVGTGVTAPAEARTVDATGKVVTPGLFDSWSRIGVVEVSAETSTRDFALEDPRLSAAFDVADAFNPRSPLVAINRIEGLTRALVAPQGGASSPIDGQGAIVHLGGVEAPLVRRAAALFVTLGEGGAERAGGSRAAALLRLREALEDTRDYLANQAAYHRGERRAYAASRLDLAALAPVVQGTTPLAVAAHRASDIEVLLRFAREQGVRLVVLGAAEAWRVAPQLSAAGVPVVLDPLDNLPERFESLAATLENAARLHAAGVTIAFATGEAHNGRNLKQLAGNAVAYGLPWEAGLAAITTAPARIWGVEDRYGSLEPGKDADLVIWDGDPLEVTTFADTVLIRGREVPMVSRQTRLRDRYMALGETTLPLAYEGGGGAGH